MLFPFLSAEVEHGQIPSSRDVLYFFFCLMLLYSKEHDTRHRVPCFSIMTTVTSDSPVDPSPCLFSGKIAIFRHDAQPFLHIKLVLGNHVGSRTRNLKQSGVQPAFLMDQVMVKTLVIQLHGPFSVLFIF